MTLPLLLAWHIANLLHSVQSRTAANAYISMINAREPDDVYINKRLLDHSLGNGYLVFLGMLLCTDLVFIVLHLVHTHTAYIPSGIYSIEQDKGHAEVFQYTKLFWIAMLLTVALFKKTSFTNFSWLLVFAYVLFDDALSIHEKAGLAISSLLTFTGELGLRPQDWGELLVTGIIGLLLLTPVALAYARGNAHEKTYSRNLAVLLGLLALFGVGVDMLHSMTNVDQWSLVEDGGEMIVVSVVLYYIFRHCFDRAAETANTPIIRHLHMRHSSIKPAIATASQHSV